MAFRPFTGARSVKGSAVDGRARKELGRRGEEAAKDFLQAAGYGIMARNVTSRLGEIDIVAQDNGVICFVEVRSRRAQAGHAQALESVGALKQRQLSKLAVAFLKNRGLWGRPARFDVISVSWDESGPACRLIKNAFPVLETYR